MDLGLSGRRALVTGASSGLGFGTAAALIAEGVEVTIVSRSEDRLDKAKANLLDSVPTATVHTLAADVADIASVSTMVRAAEQLMGGVDILIANAGGPSPGGFESTELDAYMPALELNLLSTIAMCQATVPAMRKRGWGRVVAITSITVREPNPNLILSNTARAGLTGFLKTLAREVAGDGVTVNSLQPGLHRTARVTALYDDPTEVLATIPAGVFGEADDFGRVAAFLCSDSARFITGAAVPLDGGAGHGLQ